MTVSEIEWKLIKHVFKKKKKKLQLLQIILLLSSWKDLTFSWLRSWTLYGLLFVASFVSSSSAVVKTYAEM